MLAKDVMTMRVASVLPETDIREIAKLLLDRRISAVPVIDGNGKLLGIVSEGDLMRRAETATVRHRSWWLTLLESPEQRAFDYIKSHGAHASEVMTRDVISIAEDATLEEIADALERNHIKRLPVVSDDKVIGIVSRADLLRGLATGKAAAKITKSDQDLRLAVEEALKNAEFNTQYVYVTVIDGIAQLWGAVDSAVEKKAVVVVAENTPGVQSVEDKVTVFSPKLRSMMGGE